MATAENLKKFLTKRGLGVDVTKNEATDTFSVKVKCTTVEEISNILAQIEEKGRFIISIQLEDITELLVTSSGIPERLKGLEDTIFTLAKRQIDLGEEMTKNMKNLQETDVSLERQSKSSISAILDELEKLTIVIEGLDNRIQVLEKKPWWKKW